MRLRDLCASSSAQELSIQPLTAKACSGRSIRHRLLRVFPVLLVVLAAMAAQAQQYTKIVIFGDSLSDTGNDKTVFLGTYGFPFPSPYFLTAEGIQYTGLYTDGRFTDGLDTFPPAGQHLGVWVEQLAGALPAHPAVMPSLLGGTNYAYGYGNTLSGTTLFNVTDTPFTIVVDNVGQQIDEYLATNPTIDNHTLFIVWGGANNLTEAVGDPNAPALIVDGAIAQVDNIQRLINAGATQFLVPNLPDLGSVPRFNTSPTESTVFNDASVLYNAALDSGVSLLPLLNFGRHVTIHKFDVYSLLKSIIAQPTNYGLKNATASSQSMYVDPDYYLFWDDLHPTTTGHNLLGQSALKLIEPAGCLKQVSPGQYAGVFGANCR
jgi:phospholipase/lecithinase/hemolysin